ncbi:MAG TPA: STAS/SEC14 domain-containing protein [Burkholderiales bacterium]|nr:STAS/SEC14 domain-containing protein [Burkholderiales bacterium]
MIERIPGLPDGVLGFNARGTVTAKDYETVIIPAVEALFARRKKVRFLYHLGPEFTGFEVAAMWDDTKLGLTHFTGWEKMAVVTEVPWIRIAIEAFGLAMPGRVRVFHESELAQARQWVSE